MALSRDVALSYFNNFMKRKRELPGEGLMSAKQATKDYIRFAEENLTEALGEYEIEDIWQKVQAARTWLSLAEEVLDA